MKLHEVSNTSQLTNDQVQWLKRCVNGRWTFNHRTGLVDVIGSVAMLRSMDTIPIRFGIVSGDFKCNQATITSLEGSPQQVDGLFDCSQTKIISLEHAPKQTKDFKCSGTKITSLQHSPQIVTGFFDCYNTLITTLEGAPTSVGDDFDCGPAFKLQSLKGAPTTVGRHFRFNSTQVASLDDAPTQVGGDMYFAHTPLADQLSERVLQVFKIAKKHKVNGEIRFCFERNMQQILNRHLKTGDVLACQEELIDAGYGKVARF